MTMRREVPISRSENMRRIKSKDTKPELLVRRLLWARGYRYRLHCHCLPGKPDIVFFSKKKIIFVHGCFWHMHGCRFSKVPSSNREYWLNKLTRNQDRDTASIAKLTADGWSILVVWSCETKAADLSDRLLAFLGPPKNRQKKGR